MMKYYSGCYDDFQDTLEDLLQDVILLEAMELREKQRDASMTGVPQELLSQTRRRVLDYLSQHAGDLYVLNRELIRA